MNLQMPEDLTERVTAYAERKNITPRDALLVLVDSGLRAHERATTAGALGGWRQHFRKKAQRSKRSK